MAEKLVAFDKIVHSDVVKAIENSLTGEVQLYG